MSLRVALCVMICTLNAGCGTTSAVEKGRIILMDSDGAACILVYDGMLFAEGEMDSTLSIGADCVVTSELDQEIRRVKNKKE